MTLLEGKIGGEYRVQELSLLEETRRRLEILGLTNGTLIRLMNKKKSGTSIILVRGTRFAIGRDIVAGITVKESKTVCEEGGTQDE
ncbi:MAG: ferrous iron transport protein A [Lachnospiraceae bacterium]